MADTYSANMGLTIQATGDKNWGTTANAIFTTLDAQVALGGGAVSLTEHPSTTLHVAVAALTFIAANGTIVSYAGVGSVTLTTAATNYLYLTDAGALVHNTTGFPAATNLVPLATVVCGATTITSIADARRPYGSAGAARASGTVTSVALVVPAGLTISSGSPITSAGTITLAWSSESAHLFLCGPASGGAAAMTVRAIVPADLPVFVASGASHAAGAVPDPGSSAGATRYLREDSSWGVPTGSVPALAVVVVAATGMVTGAYSADLGSATGLVSGTPAANATDLVACDSTSLGCDVSMPQVAHWGKVFRVVDFGTGGGGFGTTLHPEHTGGTPAKYNGTNSWPTLSHGTSIRLVNDGTDWWEG